MCGCSEASYLHSEMLEQPRWYAIHTRFHHEKKIEVRLREHGISTFLPWVRQVRRWTDRRKSIELPLFPCYAFVNIVPNAELRLAILRIDGVIGFVGVHREGTPIPDSEIESVRVLLDQHVPFSSHPFLRVGQRVRIRGGSLDGVEGSLIAVDCNRKLVISVELIQRSLAVTVEGYGIEAI
jgi:transcription antitermination factor NusG